MKYKDIGIMQRIALKGIIKERRNRPWFLTSEDHKYFDGLNALWIVADFRESVEMFLMNMQSHG